MENDRYNFGKHYIVLDTKIDNHINSKNNPHNVTKADVGLNKLENRLLEREVTEDSENYVTSGAVFTVTSDLQTQIDQKASTLNVVHIYEDETIEGEKTFNKQANFNDGINLLGELNYTFSDELGTSSFKTITGTSFNYTFTPIEGEVVNYNYLIPTFEENDLEARFIVEKSKLEENEWKTSKSGETELAYSFLQTELDDKKVTEQKSTAYSDGFKYERKRSINDEEPVEEVYKYGFPAKTGYFVIDELEPESKGHVIYDTKKVTYSQLKKLRNTNKLIPGQFYQITDYQTTTAKENTFSAGNQFDIVVQALSENVLSEEAKATYHRDEAGQFDGYFSSSKVVSYELKNPNQSPKDIEVLYKVFSNDEKLYWNVRESSKDISEITWEMINGLNTPILINPDPNPQTHNDYYYKYKGKFTLKRYTNSLVSILYTITDGDEILYTTSKRNFNTVFVKLDHFYVTGRNVPVLYKENDQILLADKNSYDPAVVYIYQGDYSLDGVNYNRWRKFTQDDPTIEWQDTDKEILTQVIVADGDFIISQNQLTASLKLEDAIYDEWIQLNENHEETGYEYLTNSIIDVNYAPEVSANLSAWKIKYCFDNDVNRFDWADAITGKGVIYHMIDEWGNEAPYDFKNILFTKDGKYNNAYTFSFTESSLIKDASMYGRDSNVVCHDNVIKEYINGNKQALNFNVFYSDSSTLDAKNNIFGKDCHDNTFGIHTKGNKFDEECYNNVMGSYLQYCEFGESSYDNELGQHSSGIRFIKNCHHVKFGEALSTIDYCRRIVLDDGCSYLYIKSSDTQASAENQLQHIHIHLAVSGTSVARKTLTIDRNLNYETSIYANGSKDIILE